MKRLSILTILLALACDPSNAKTAIDDLELPPRAKGFACQLYNEVGKERAKRVWENDFPVFAPIWATPPDPVADQAFCRRVAGDLGVRFVTKLEGSKSSTALIRVIALHHNFESWGPKRQASILCHEVAHTVWENARGTKATIASVAAVTLEYLVGILVYEGFGYALGDKLSERYGISPEELADVQKPREKEFPKRYYIDRLVEPVCVSRQFAAMRGEFDRRLGSHVQ